MLGEEKLKYAQVCRQLEDNNSKLKKLKKKFSLMKELSNSYRVNFKDI